MPVTIKSEAIVLKKRNLPGQDTIVTLFTLSEGKIGVSAKGIKKITSRRAPHVQTGNLINVILAESNSRYYLQDTQLTSGFTSIKEVQGKVDMLYFFFFVVDRMTPDRQAEEDVYRLLKNFLVDLSNATNFSKENLSVYLHDLLEVLGYDKGAQTYNDLIRNIEEIIHEKLPTSVI